MAVGKIAGTVKVKGVVLAGAPCILFSEDTDTKVATTTTNASGYFEFTGLDTADLFYVVVKQTDPKWEHIVSSRRNPA